MKYLLITLTLIFCSYTFELNAQNDIKIDENTIIKNEDGKQITLDSFSKLMQSGKYVVDFKQDNKGNDFVQLKKASKEEQARFIKMMLEQSEAENLVGTKAPNFEFTDMDGNTVNSENTAGKVVVLNFWFTSCKPCISEIPELNEVYEHFEKRDDIVFASITFNPKEKVEKFLKRYPINYPVVTDDESTISDFKVFGYPTNIVIGKDGNYADVISGGFPQIGEYITNSIEKALD